MKLVNNLCLLVIIGSCIGQECDDKGLRKFDQTIAKTVTLGGTGRKFPTNKVDFKKFCR